MQTKRTSKSFLVAFTGAALATICLLLLASSTYAHKDGRQNAAQAAQEAPGNGKGGGSGNGHQGGQPPAGGEDGEGAAGAAATQESQAAAPPSGPAAQPETAHGSATRASGGHQRSPSRQAHGNPHAAKASHHSARAAATLSTPSATTPTVSTPVGPVGGSVSTKGSGEKAGGSEPVKGVSTPEVSLPSAQVQANVGNQPSTTSSTPTGGGAGAASPSGSTQAAADPAAASGSSPRLTGGSTGGGRRPKASRSAASSGSRGGATAGARRASGAAAGTGAAAAAGGPPAASRTARANRAASARRSGRHHHQAHKDPLSALGGHLPIGLPVPDWSRPIILALLLATLAFGARALLIARRARRLERTQTALVSDLLVMQSALVPEVPAELAGLGISAAYRPAEGPAAGGDFYDVFALPDGRAALILGDVSGHGHSALKQAALTRYTLRAYLEAGLEPGAALKLAGQVMSDPTFDHFATVIAGIYDERTGMLTYGSAGHPPPLTSLIPGPEVLGGFSAPPLGWDVPTGQRQTVLALPPGATVCFFSDGLTEARTHGDLLNREGLRALLTELGEQPSAGELLALVTERTESASDDMAACIIQQRARTLTVCPARWEELEIDDEALSTGSPERFLESCGLGDEQIEAVLGKARKLLAHSASARLRVRVDLACAADAQTLDSPTRTLDAEPTPNVITV